MIDYAAVLNVVRPGTEWSVNETYESLIWLDKSPKPSQAELDAAWPQVQADRQKASVQAQRAARYRAETDPLFFKAQRGEDGVTLDDWQAAVDAIRTDLPYPS